MAFSTILAIIVTVICILLGLFFRLAEITYNAIVETTGIPKLRTFFPLGSWYGKWGKVLGEDDLSNVQLYGKLYWGYDGNRPNLFVSDPELIEPILANKSNQFESYRAGRVKESVLCSSLKVIEKSSDRDSEIFNKTNIEKLVPRIEQSCEALIQEMKKKEGNIHTQQVFMQYLGDVIANTVFGIDLYSEDFKEQRSKFMENINRVFNVFNPTSISSIFPYVFKNFRSLDNSILPSEAVTFFSELCMSVVEKKRELTSGVQTETRSADLIDLLLEKHQKDEKSTEESSKVETVMADAEIIIHCLSVILFTVRSTESSLSQSMHVLSSLEEDQSKLHKELYGISQPSGESSHGYRCLDVKYLDIFLKEIHRLYPIEYRLVRDCQESFKLGQHTIPAQVTVSIPVYALHHLPEYFPDPLNFNPERFLDAKAGEIKNWSYLPYGQACSNTSFVGFQLTVLFTKIALTYLIKNFKITPPVPHFQAPLNFTKGATEVPVLMPVVIQLEKRT